MDKFKLRFKTEKELIEQYGYNWRRRHQYIWVDPMDYFFGKEIDKKYYFQFIDNKGEFIMKRDGDIMYIPKSDNIYDCWKVYLYQIKVLNTSIDYNKPKILIYD